MSEFFYLKADKKMSDNVDWNYIPNMRDQYGSPSSIMPMTDSIEARHLVWEIPDNEHNRTLITRYYHNFITTETLPTAKKVEKLEKKVDVPKVVADTKEEEVVEKDEDDGYAIPTNPKEMQQLKAKIWAELDESGIPYSKNSSLKILRELQKNA